MTILAVVVSYLLGSIPTGLWLGLTLRGVDIRRCGSHNIGATNTMRVLGKKLGAVALVVDILKGWVPVVLLAPWLSDWSHATIACGFAAILGHVTSPWVKFRGGKGVATSAGVFLGLAPYPTLIAAVVFFAVVALTRMASAASLAAAVTLAASIFVFSADPVVQAVTVVVALLVVFRHRSNIQRILQGTENRI